MQFRDFVSGQVLRTESRIVCEQEIIDFATRYDPQWFHMDPVKADVGRWKGIIASGWLTCSIAMELVTRAILHGSESFGSPGVEQLEWLIPLRPGDQVRCEVEVINVRRSDSGNTGSVKWRWTMINQRNEAILKLTTISLFDLRESTAI